VIINADPVFCSTIRTQTFEEFIELASKGDPHNVDVYTNEMFDLFTGAGTADSDDIYTKTASAINASPSVVFCFGKAAASNANLGLSCSVVVNDKKPNCLF
jgi:hypothetical protein